MGNTGLEESQIGTDLTKTQSNVLISPTEAYAIRCKETSLMKIFPQLVKNVDLVKKQESFDSVHSEVEKCPIYYLKHLGCFYQGQWLDCLPHGCGIAIYKNKSYYQGQFRKGELDSKLALYYFNNGQESQTQPRSLNLTKQNSSPKMEEQISKQILSTYYIGSFQGSKFNGKGKLFHRGLVYQGDWQKGKRQGQGKQYSAQHNYTYQGQFANGFKYGSGVYKCKIGDQTYCYSGSFFCGLFHGKGRLSLDERQDIFKGSFLNGYAEGEGTLICDWGVLKCVFQNNRVKGKGEFVFNDQSKPKLEGQFFDEIVANGQIRRIIQEGLMISEAPFIDFKKLMINVESI